MYTSPEPPRPEVETQLPLLFRLAPLFMILGAIQLATTPIMQANSSVRIYPSELASWNYISAVVLLIGGIGVWKRQRWAAFLTVMWALVQNGVYAAANEWQLGLLLGAGFYFVLMFPYLFPKRFAEMRAQQIEDRRR